MRGEKDGEGEEVKVATASHDLLLGKLRNR